MRRIAATALAAALAASAFAAKPLPRPFWGDPTLQTAQRPKTGADAWAYLSAFVDPPGLAAVTLCGWLRYDPPADAKVFFPLVVMADFSNVPARATAEGGATLPDLCPSNWWDGDDDLPLAADGTWAATLLPASYDMPPDFAAADRWRHGCYAVNVLTDSPLTLTVGGEELQVPATNLFACNVMAASASRAVSVAASDPAARVRFGIAENPLVQFVGAQFDGMDPGGLTPADEELGGVITNGWRFVVARARIDGGTNLAVSVCGYTRSARLENAGAVSQRLWRPSATFAPDARARVILCGLIGTDGVVLGYGWRAYGGWLGDALVDRMRDQDWAELVRRGLVRPGDEDTGTDAAETQGGN